MVLGMAARLLRLASDPSTFGGRRPTVLYWKLRTAFGLRSGRASGWGDNIGFPFSGTERRENSIGGFPKAVSTHWGAANAGVAKISARQIIGTNFMGVASSQFSKRGRA